MKPAAAVPVRLALAAAVAFALAAASAPPSHPDAGAGGARAALLTVPADLPPALLGEAVAAKLTVRVAVSPEGLVDSAVAVAGDARLRASAEAAARWWVFTPAARPATLTVSVPVEAARDAADLRPDVLAMARESEAHGDLPTALAAWVGALARVGTSPTVANEWAIREHAIALARRMSPPPPLPNVVWGPARGARGQQLRTVARAKHVELVAQFDTALREAPWWDEPYLWRAGSLAGCGRTAEALRSLRAYRLASTDTAGIAFAERLMSRLAAADTIGVCEAVKTWRVTAEPAPR